MGATKQYSMTDVRNNDHGVSNLLHLYAQATASELRAGHNWYADAHADAIKLSKLYGIDVETVIKVAAVLSPQMDWDNNMPAAESAIRYYLGDGYAPPLGAYKKFGGEFNLQPTYHYPHLHALTEDAMFENYTIAYRANQIKAQWVLQGHDGVIEGPKVNTFIDNITHYDSSDLVTVDSHAIQAWLGIMEPGTYSVPDKAYKLIEADYQRAAALVGVSPLQLQAVVWLVKKRITDSKDLDVRVDAQVEWQVAE